MALSRQNAPIPDRGPKVEVVSLVMASLSILAVSARLFRRLGMSESSFGWDDAAISLALALTIGRASADVVAVQNFGFGKHEADLPPSTAHSHKADLLFWTSQLLYKSCILCTKESICFLYLRLFSVGHRRFRIRVISSMIFIALYYIIAILLTIFECTPVKKSWEKQIAGTCINLQTFFFANAAFNVITDILVMVLPIPVIAKLQITRKQRIGLGLIFCVGILATATSIVRMTTLQTGSKSTDITWTTTNSTIWSGIEINVAIVCACLPILRAPLQAIFPRLLGRTTVSSHTATEGTAGTSGGGWSRIAAGALRSKTDDKDVDGLEMGAVGGKGVGLGKTMTTGGESGSEDEKYILGDEESTTGVAISKGGARQTESRRQRGLDGHRDSIAGGIVKTTDVSVDYGRT